VAGKKGFNQSLSGGLFIILLFRLFSAAFGKTRLFCVEK
jgi:hypothetical protein